MKTAQQIRFENFDALLKEAGSQAALARSSGIAKPYINQLAKRTPLPSGSERSIGDDSARRLEDGMGKEEGWMDADHSLPDFDELSAQEARLITLYRKLPAADQQRLLQSADQLFAAHFEGVQKAGAKGVATQRIEIKVKEEHQ